MGLAKTDDKNLFDELGLEVTQGDVEVGKTYPIFGMITELLDDEPGNVIVEINYNIKAQMNIPNSDKVNLLKERAFESGIFVAKVITKEPEVLVDCQTVIFGRSQAFNA